MLCPRCEREELYDEGPLCWDCLADVDMGCCVRGDYGAVERRESLTAIGRGLRIERLADRAREAGRLRRLADRWA